MDWQTNIAIAFVVVAAIAVARRAWRALFEMSGNSCGSHCHSCPTATAGDKSSTPLLSIEVEPQTPADRNF
jgi:hypothetical protein